MDVIEFYFFINLLESSVFKTIYNLQGFENLADWLII